MDKRIFSTLIFLGMAFSTPAMALTNEAVARDHYNRGTQLYVKGDMQAAEADLAEAIRLDARAYDSYYNRGWTYRRRLRNAEALSDFSRAIELYPNQASYFLSRANVRIVERDYDGGVADATRAIELLPGSAK